MSNWLFLQKMRGVMPGDYVKIKLCFYSRRLKKNSHVGDCYIILPKKGRKISIRNESFKVAVLTEGYDSESLSLHLKVFIEYYPLRKWSPKRLLIFKRIENKPNFYPRVELLSPKNLVRNVKQYLVTNKDYKDQSL